MTWCYGARLKTVSHHFGMHSRADVNEMRLAEIQRPMPYYATKCRVV